MIRLLIGGILSLMIAMGIGRFAYTPILPLMQSSLGFDDAMAGYLASSNYAGYFIGAVIAAIFPINKHKILFLRINLIVSILSTLGMGTFYSYIPLLILRFISGLASAFIFVFTSSIVLDTLAAASKTNWAGLLYSGVGFGIFFSSLFIPSLNNLFEWKGVWIGLAIISSFLTIFVWLWLKESPEKTKTKTDELDKHENIRLVPPTTWLPWLIASYGLEGLGYVVTGTFIVSIAENTSYFRNDPVLVWIIVGLSAIPSCVVWSGIAKKQGFVTSLFFSMTLQAIGIILPVFWLSRMSLVLSAVLFGATFMGITTLATTLSRQIQPINSNRVIGYLTAIYALGQMIGPSIAGLMNTYTQSYDYTLVGASSVVFIGALLLMSGFRYETIRN